MRFAKYLLVFLLLASLGASAQRWKRYKYRYELSCALGATDFLGDLGGANRIGSHGIPSVRDLDYVLTRPVIAGGCRFLTSYYTSAKVNLSYGILRGDDKETMERFRHNRNLNFKSPVLEISGQFEVNYSFERGGHRYHIKRVKGRKNADNRIYAFAGVGAFYFNPKGRYVNGAWYALRPFHTEGEGLVPGHNNYNRISICFPIGIGGKYSLDRNWSIGMEFGLRYTLTDYIDDVSTVYETSAVTTALNNPIATYFANPTVNELGSYVTADGQQRGDPTHKDSYMFITFSVNYKVFRAGYRPKAKF
ncbi:MAG TPA: hypothetical protein VI112_16650 [Bacteroidia bacterium]|jgi:hypothetical protein